MNRTSPEEQATEEDTASWGFVECAIPGGLLALVITWELTRPPSERDTLLPRIVTCVAFVLVMAYLVMRVRRRAARELLQVRAVARAAQEVLLRPLPSRLDGLALHARQLSASRGADVGGDLYEVMATTYGVRVVIGDVRGHGLPAIGAVAAVLGSFREAAHDERGLDGVLRRLDRAHQRHLKELARRDPDCEAALRVALLAEAAATEGASAAEVAEACRAAQRMAEADAADAAEEFVTVLLLEIGPDAEIRALNCGHPWPYRLGPGAEPLACEEPLPPLGAVPLPAELTPYRCGRLLPGEALFLHTDGAEDARDAQGRFFGLKEALVEAASVTELSPVAVVRQVHAALLRHTGGRITDDMALLVLRNDRVDGTLCAAAGRQSGPADRSGAERTLADLAGTDRTASVRTGTDGSVADGTGTDGSAADGPRAPDGPLTPDISDRLPAPDAAPPTQEGPPVSGQAQPGCRAVLEERTRVPTQSGDPALRRTRPAPSRP
ncbi:PP2C family protein-serine/threonine phosphatase [Streptomyces sp. NPDC059092]|uniref:PP2C family protein-serine/threonine phosphatase n=1 Tax=Streptomyces sp. NPDC059092 TaxID=3346725 RepID=UPI0036A167E2